MEGSPSPERPVLWAPWREKYVLGDRPDGCVFCMDPSQDSERFVVWRERSVFAVLNLYPYTNGHLLIVPVRHVADLTVLTEEESAGLMKGIQVGMKGLEKAFHPDGFNVGINLGKAAGAGVTDHMHVHVVPRWQGDTNFFSVVSGTRVLCQEMSRTYELLKGIIESEALE